LAEFDRDLHDLNGEWRKRFPEKNQQRDIARGFRPCLRCEAKLVLSVTGICNPCRDRKCKKCRRSYRPNQVTSQYCHDCRRYHGG
jgi:hypothetical protein